MRSRWLGCGLALTAVAAVWGGWSWVRLSVPIATSWSSRAARSPRAVIHAARERLVELVKRRPGWDEVHYQLGLCEEARGQAEAALAAWSRVAPGSPFAGKTAMARGRVLTEHRPVRRRPRTSCCAIPRGRDADGTLLRQSLELLYRVEGRNREVRELILESWAQSPDPAHVLRRLYLLDDSAFPVDYVKQALRGRRPAGRPGLAGPGQSGDLAGSVRRGRRDGSTPAKTRRPEDPAVWSARLDLARASQDVGGGPAGPGPSAGDLVPPGRDPPAPVLAGRADRR